MLAFVEGRLGQETRASVVTHLDGCVSCQDVVASVAPALLSRAQSPAESPLARDSALPRGATIGRYVVLALVGRGGMGEVYAAYDPELDRKIALKLLHGGEGETDAGRARMLREAKAIARLSHPNVVVVHDAGTIGARVFIAMEFVEGRTLADWLGERPRDWRDVRDVFVAAGRALAAAHAAGLVHRDFKPQNVMVGNDGKVRVMDFGLALTSADAPEMGDPRDLERLDPSAQGAVVALTHTGTLLGTPAYMAPEQFAAEAADARTDQFSYCVALHEALYGERPFAGSSLTELAVAVTRGTPREPAQRNRAPVWLRRLIARGLLPERARRWPSMNELLAVLERDPARARRRWLAAAGALLLLVAGVVGQRVAARAQAPLCRGAAAALATAWEPSGGAGTRREATRAAFVAASPELGADAWRRVAQILDGYARSWSEQYTSTCEATQIRGEQSAEIMDLKMDCLGQALDGLRAVTGVFEKADRTVVVQAVDAALALPGLDRCKDAQALRAVVPLPTDKAARARIDELRRRNADVKALFYTGRLDEARRQSAELLRVAPDVHYAPLLAEIEFNAGLVDLEMVQIPTGEALAERAFWRALESKQDELAANAAILIAGELGDAGLAEREARWERLAVALLARMGPGHDVLRSWILQARGNLAERERRLEDARAAFSEAVALKVRALGPEHPDVARSTDALGQVLEDMGEHEAALAQSQRALTIGENASGKDSPVLVYIVSNRGEILNSLGRATEAVQTFERALAMVHASMPDDSPYAAFPLTGLGKAYLMLGRDDEAVATLERALRIREKGDRICQRLGETRFALARALRARGNADDLGRARALGAAARDAYAGCKGYDPERATVDRWLGAEARRR
ncbi:MAG TPA: serine/threonine-protein kinase [Polyangia bacterium]|nr:serine/threonine-protein kinase [Polyangia bacterium]